MDVVRIEPSPHYRPSKEDIPVASKIEKLSQYTSMLKDMIELGDRVRVRDDLTLVYIEEPNKPIMYVTDTTTRPLVLIGSEGSNIEDAIRVDPSREVSVSRDEPNDKAWFFDKITKTTAEYFSNIMDLLMFNAIKVATGHENEVSPDLLKPLSLIVNKVDDKTAKEYTKIGALVPLLQNDLEVDEQMAEEVKLLTQNRGPRAYFSIHRVKNNRYVYLDTFINDETGEVKKQLGNKIRKKTWAVLTQVVGTILQVADTETLKRANRLSFDAPADSKCPMLAAFAQALVHVWNCYIPFFDFLMDEESAKANIRRISNIEKCIPILNDLAGSSYTKLMAQVDYDGHLTAPDAESLETESYKNATPTVRSRRGRMSHSESDAKCNWWYFGKINPEPTDKKFTERGLPAGSKGELEDSHDARKEENSESSTSNEQPVKTEEKPTKSKEKGTVLNDPSIAVREAAQERKIANLEQRLAVIESQKKETVPVSSTPDPKPVSQEQSAKPSIYGSAFNAPEASDPYRYRGYNQQPSWTQVAPTNDFDRYRTSQSDYQQRRNEELNRFQASRTTSNSIYSEYSYGDMRAQNAYTNYPGNGYAFNWRR